jgi:hypothetical protein
MWKEYDKGKTIGTKGSEQGTIVLDEQYELGSRITLEKNGTTAPWGITCGIYGEFVHTAFASSEEKARSMYTSMKQELLRILHEENADKRYEELRGFADRY